MQDDSGAQAPAAPRAGRPRDTHLDEAILRAADAALTDTGYRALTWEDVARRGRTTKPAIRRRWPSRQHLVLAVLARRLGDTHVPDTDCTLCDLIEGIQLFVAVFERMPPDLLGPLLADCADDPALHADFMATLFEPPRSAVGRILDRAVARGDLRDDVDRELALDLLGSLVHYRAVFGHAPLSGVQIELAVESLLRGLASDCAALLERSRAQRGDPAVHHLHSDVT